MFPTLPGSVVVCLPRKHGTYTSVRILQLTAVWFTVVCKDCSDCWMSLSWEYSDVPSSGQGSVFIYAVLIGLQCAYLAPCPKENTKFLCVPVSLISLYSTVHYILPSDFTLHHCHQTELITRQRYQLNLSTDIKCSLFPPIIFCMLIQPNSDKLQITKIIQLIPSVKQSIQGALITLSLMKYLEQKGVQIRVPKQIHTHIK